MEFLGFIIWALMIIWSYNVAKERGRSTGWAIFWGFMFGIFAVLVYFMVGDTQEVKDAKLNALLDAREETLKK
jgi:hypothetical protein